MSPRAWDSFSWSNGNDHTVIFDFICTVYYAGCLPIGWMMVDGFYNLLARFKMVEDINGI